jgi:hypothetical protein
MGKGYVVRIHRQTPAAVAAVKGTRRGAQRLAGEESPDVHSPPLHLILTRSVVGSDQLQGVRPLSLTLARDC